jgi:hypothetical protein
MLRSLGAVFAGYVMLAIVIMVLFALFPRAPQTLSHRGFAALQYVIEFAAALTGGYVAATLARRAELTHAAALALFASVLELLNLVSGSTGEPFALWFAALVSGAVGILLGGVLRVLVPRHLLLHLLLRRKRDSRRRL